MQLFSVSAVANKGYSVQFDKNLCLIKSGKGKVKGVGTLVENFIILTADLLRGLLLLPLLKLEV